MCVSALIDQKYKQHFSLLFSIDIVEQNIYDYCFHLNYSYLVRRREHYSLFVSNLYIYIIINGLYIRVVIY